MEQEKIRVLMIGPARSVHGGISGVVNNYYGAGLDELVDLCYIGTMVEGSKIRKLWQAAKAYVRFLVRLPRCESASDPALLCSWIHPPFFFTIASRV